MGGHDVDRLRGADHGRRERHAEHRLEQHRDRRVGRLELGDGAVEIRWVEAERDEERVGLGRGDVLGAAVGQRAEHGRHLHERVVADARHRCVAGPAARGEREAEDALLGDAHSVDAPVAVADQLAGALVHDEIGAHVLRLLSAEPLRPVPGAALLVGGEDELQLARLRSPALLDERERGPELGRHLALHVLGAAAPDAVVAQLARPGVELPVAGVGRHRVDVPEQAQGGAVRGGGEACNEVRPARHGLEQHAVEPGLLEQALEPLLGRPLVARRVDRVEADEALQELCRAALECGALGHDAESKQRIEWPSCRPPPVSHTGRPGRPTGRSRCSCTATPSRRTCGAACCRCSRTPAGAPSPPTSRGWATRPPTCRATWERHADSVERLRAELGHRALRARPARLGRPDRPALGLRAAAGGRGARDQRVRLLPGRQVARLR